MSDLTRDELTVLLIAAEGESMMPIGRWEAPLKSLLAKGYMHANDKFNNVITPAGRAAAQRDEDDTARRMIEANNNVVHGKEQARASAEAIAFQMVDLAEMSSKITGGSAESALRLWAPQIVARAQELIRGK